MLNLCNNSISDEVRALMGTESVRLGVARIFQMFQHKTLNKRLLYVILEGILIHLFPDNKFPALFRKLHSQSTRAEKVREQKKASSTTGGSSGGASQDGSNSSRRSLKQ